MHKSPFVDIACRECAMETSDIPSRNDSHVDKIRDEEEKVVLDLATILITWREKIRLRIML